ncbi:MAG: HPr kinase/phosphorylase [Burkholderiaceae bacterium]|nr:MAG: HPr kinase/phosphorylase [Burkholderiaceae bacterium]
MFRACDVAHLHEDNAEALKLAWRAGKSGAERVLAEQGGYSANLVGHLNLIHKRRIQILGPEEMEYVNGMAADHRSYLIQELVSSHPPAVIVAEDIAAPEELIAQCDQQAVPLFSSPLDSAQIIDVLRVYLSKELAPGCLMHGVFMDVLGVGVLITGDSGLGKSELGLELISRGHGLVADDAIEFSRIAPYMVEGRCPPLLQNLLEVRGLGLLDIRAIFGETAVRRKMRLTLIVNLLGRSMMKEDFQRLPLDAQTQDVLGMAIPKVVIPVAAGRNLAVLVEAAVRNTILQLRGIDTMKDFLERQRLEMLRSAAIDPEDSEDT